ncbi:SIMPL domain-containing protein [Sphingomonas lenta]|uniref:SIMPL domain-containing protein n=1 Tax=Sphingomonas lenta TaxID=1141887 RepID=A0A2A2SFS3_9SPHN|nr:SIMPL domain-containing protein [Sphingomonas lenta]PAX08055.1 hypothetical protein CKY28_10700 [Sphingomonas lenta]
MRWTTATLASMLAASGAAAQLPPAVPHTVEPLVPASGAVLDVVAQGRTTRVPDLAVIRAGVVTQAPTAAEALRANSDRMARVLAALRRAGVAARDVQTAQVSLQPQYRYGENQPPVVTGYQAANSVAVRFRDVARSGAILDALVAEGANQIDGPTLTLDQPDAALDEARTDAIRRARARADLYARAAGMRVERIVSIAEGAVVDGPRPPSPVALRTFDAAEAKTQIAAGEQEVTATATVRFVLR